MGKLTARQVSTLGPGMHGDGDGLYLSVSDSGALLLDAGWTPEQVQALMGHSDVAMTKAYLEGHEAPWQAVCTGIALPNRVAIG